MSVIVARCGARRRVLAFALRCLVHAVVHAAACASWFAERYLRYIHILSMINLLIVLACVLSGVSARKAKLDDDYSTYLCIYRCPTYFDNRCYTPMSVPADCPTDFYCNDGTHAEQFVYAATGLSYEDCVPYDCALSPSPKYYPGFPPEVNSSNFCDLGAGVSKARAPLAGIKALLEPDRFDGESGWTRVHATSLPRGRNVHLEYKAALAENAVVHNLDSLDYVVRVDCSSDSMVLHHKAAKNVLLPKPGAFVVGGRHWGCTSSARRSSILRKVVAVAQVGSRVLLSTLDAAYSHVFKDANIRYRGNVWHLLERKRTRELVAATLGGAAALVSQARIFRESFQARLGCGETSCRGRW